MNTLYTIEQIKAAVRIAGGLFDDIFQRGASFYMETTGYFSTHDMKTVHALNLAGFTVRHDMHESGGTLDYRLIKFDADGWQPVPAYVIRASERNISDIIASRGINARVTTKAVGFSVPNVSPHLVGELIDCGLDVISHDPDDIIFRFHPPCIEPGTYVKYLTNCVGQVATNGAYYEELTDRYRILRLSKAGGSEMVPSYKLRLAHKIEDVRVGMTIHLTGGTPAVLVKEIVPDGDENLRMRVINAKFDIDQYIGSSKFPYIEIVADYKGGQDDY